ncbi:MAG TPA: hypothetical protein PKV86_13780 [Syntrophobacteraceae bacterium]|nr:hypothetical protein [Syntrophobacteraceae bacterium]
MPKAVYGDYVFEFDDVTANRPVSGQELRERIAKRVGEQPEGAIVVHRSDGSMEHVAADENVRLGPDDSVGVTGQFETAAQCPDSHTDL